MAGTGRTRRCVVIWHPDFQASGGAGASAAKEHASQLQQGARHTVAEVAAAGDQNLAMTLGAHIAGFKYYVRSLPEDLL